MARKSARQACLSHSGRSPRGRRSLQSSNLETGAFHAAQYVERPGVDLLSEAYREHGSGDADPRGRLYPYGLLPYPLYFMHVNGRHHSFAMVGSGQAGLHHLMVEFENLDDVGQGYDRAQVEEGRVACTLGRHLNDYVTSYYASTPLGFFVDSGWGGRVIDPATWTPHETFDGPSSWGHERLYLSEEMRKKLRDMRIDSAARGRRKPHLAECPWLFGELAKQR